MLMLALRGVRNNPFRYFSTAIAIILGVGFFVATSVFTDSFRDSFNNSIAKAFEDVDGAVRSTDSIDFQGFEIRNQISPEFADSLREIDGVAAAEPYLAGYAQIVASDGKVLDSTGETQGFAWIEDEALSPFAIVDGRAPETPIEVAIDSDTLAASGFAVGDEIRVLPAPEEVTYTIVGEIVSDGSDDFTSQAVALSYDGASLLLGTSEVDQIFMLADDGLTPEELVARVNAELDPGLEAVTGQALIDEFQELIGQFANIVDIALKVFAAVALFVGAFVIYNTFSITVAQRTKEMALLRAIGASGKQVRRSVLVEAVVIGVLASAIGAVTGILLGWGLINLLTAFFDGFNISLSIPAGAMANGVIIGTILTVLSAFVPAHRGARIAPIEALRDAQIEEVGASRTRGVIGVGLLITGAAAAVWGATEGSWWYLAYGIPALIFAVFVSGPVYVRPVTNVLSIPLVRNGSIVGELSRENAARNPKRTATTSLTLMIGVTLMVTAAVFASTLKTTIESDLDEQILATDIVEVAGADQGPGSAGLDPSYVDSIAALDGVDAATGVRNVPAEVDGDFTTVAGYDTADLLSVLQFESVDGRVANLGVGEVAMSVGLADDLGHDIGDTVEVTFIEQQIPLTLAGLFDGNDVVGDVVVDVVTLDSNLPRSLDSMIFVAADGSDGVESAIEDVLAADPTALLTSKADYITDQAGLVNQLLYVLYGLLGMSVIVALIGIVNTMALSIHERTRELGLLRAVGMNRGQLRRTIRYESALVALMGTSVGMVLGIFFGWLAKLASGDAIASFTVPWFQLLIVTVVGIASGVLAGLLPARRASNLDVLESISNE